MGFRKPIALIVGLGILLYFIACLKLMMMLLNFYFGVCCLTLKRHLLSYQLFENRFGMHFMNLLKMKLYHSGSQNFYTSTPNTKVKFFTNLLTHSSFKSCFKA